MMIEYYDKNGKPISVFTWMELLGIKGYRDVGKDVTKHGYKVYTVHLGLNHRFGEGAPLIFETMVFEPNSLHNIDCERYSTLREAEEGHKRMLSKYMNYKGEKHVRRNKTRNRRKQKRTNRV